MTNISQHSTSTRAGLDLAGLDFDKTGIVFYKGRDIRLGGPRNEGLTITGESIGCS